MALLRMLAFRPLSMTADDEPRPAGRPATRRASGAGTAPVPEGSSVAVPAVAVESGSEWPALVAALDLQGPARQLANHCVLTARSGDVFRLRLDRSGEIFRRPQLEQKLAQALSEQLGRPLRIEISVSDAAEDTPARRQAQAVRRTAARGRGSDRSGPGGARDARSFRRDGAAGLRQAAQLTIHTSRESARR